MIFHLFAFDPVVQSYASSIRIKIQRDDRHSIDDIVTIQWFQRDFSCSIPNRWEWKKDFVRSEKKNGSVREKMHSIGLIIGLLCGWNSKYVLSLHLSGNHSVNWKKDESSLVDKMQIRLIFKSHYESTTEPSQEKSMPQYSITNKKVHFFPNVSIIQSDFISESHIQMVEMAF